MADENKEKRSQIITAVTALSNFNTRQSQFLLIRVPVDFRTAQFENMLITTFPERGENIKKFRAIRANESMTRIIRYCQCKVTRHIMSPSNAKQHTRVPDDDVLEKVSVRHIGLVRALREKR